MFLTVFSCLGHNLFEFFFIMTPFGLIFDAKVGFLLRRYVITPRFNNREDINALNIQSNWKINYIFFIGLDLP